MAGYIRFCFLFLAFAMVGCGNHSESGEVIIQSIRNNLIDVSSQVREFSPDELPMSSSHAYLQVHDNFIIVKDHKAVGKMIHLFNKDTWDYVGSAGDLGQGPGEISNLGSVAIDALSGLLLVTDLGGSRVLSYDIDSIRVLADYTPHVRARFENATIPISYQYLNDTLSYGVIGNANFEKNTMAQMAGIWNMSTGEVITHQHELANLKVFRVSCAYSTEHQTLVECNRYYDLINVFDKDLNLKFRIKGPRWSASGDNMSHFGDVVWYKDKFIAAYAGYDYDKHQYVKQCHVISMNGDYVMTLNIGKNIWHLTIDEENGILYFTFADEVIQFGYLDLKGILD